MSNELGEYLREARESQKITTRRLGEKAGISFQYVSELENGNLKNPSMKVILKLIEHLNLDMDEFMSKKNKV